MGHATVESENELPLAWAGVYTCAANACGNVNPFCKLSVPRRICKCLIRNARGERIEPPTLVCSKGFNEIRKPWA